MGKNRNVSKRKGKKYKPKLNKPKQKKSNYRDYLLILASVTAFVFTLYKNLPFKTIEPSHLKEITIVLDTSIVYSDDETKKVLWSKNHECTFQIANAGTHNNNQGIELKDLREGEILHLGVYQRDLREDILQNRLMKVDFYSIRTDEFIVFSADDYNASRRNHSLQSILFFSAMIGLFYYFSRE